MHNCETVDFLKIFITMLLLLFFSRIAQQTERREKERRRKLYQGQATEFHRCSCKTRMKSLLRWRVYKFIRIGMPVWKGIDSRAAKQQKCSEQFEVKKKNRWQQRVFERCAATNWIRGAILRTQGSRGNGARLVERNNSLTKQSLFLLLFSLRSRSKSSHWKGFNFVVVVRSVENNER